MCKVTAIKNKNSQTKLRVDDFSLFFVRFPYPTQICRGDVKERGDVFKGENRENVLVPFYKFIVSLFCGFYI